MFSPLVDVLNNMRVILATSSKQRAEILAKTALKFETRTSNFEENLDPTKYSFEDYVQLTARAKVEIIYNELKNDKHPPDLIIGLDTMVSHESKMYGKPKDNNDAFDIIRRLTSSGKPHSLLTGVAIYYKETFLQFVESTNVYMEQLTDEEISSYVETGEPIGKAGAYAIQGLAATFVKKIEGDYNNVIGLPLCRISTELKKLITI